MNFPPKEFLINNLLLTRLNTLQDLTFTILDTQEVLEAMPNLERPHICILKGVEPFQPQRSSFQTLSCWAFGFL
jgi:hypothetical protein